LGDWCLVLGAWCLCLCLCKTSVQPPSFHQLMERFSHNKHVDTRYLLTVTSVVGHSAPPSETDTTLSLAAPNSWKAFPTFPLFSKCKAWPGQNSVREITNIQGWTPGLLIEAIWANITVVKGKVFLKFYYSLLTLGPCLILHQFRLVITEPAIHLNFSCHDAAS
jgi:hypothetical protein